MKNERYFAIGDLHGHYTEFVSLLDVLERQAAFHLRFDHLVLLGDLVDNGHEVKQLLDHVYKLQHDYPEHVHVIRGNHEDLLLDAFDPSHPRYGDYYLWYNQGGKETLKSFIPSGLTDYEKAIVQPEELIGKTLLDWLASLPYYYETPDYFFVHGGVLPDVLLKDHDFTDPDTLYKMLWIRDEFINSKFEWEKKIIFGHTAKDVSGGQYASFEPWVMDNKIGINTLPRNLGMLTAVQLPQRKFYQVGRATIQIKKKEVSDNAQEQEDKWQNRD